MPWDNIVISVGEGLTGGVLVSLLISVLKSFGLPKDRAPLVTYLLGGVVLAYDLAINGNALLYSFVKAFGVIVGSPGFYEAFTKGIYRNLVAENVKQVFGVGVGVGVSAGNSGSRATNKWDDYENEDDDSAEEFYPVKRKKR